MSQAMEKDGPLSASELEQSMGEQVCPETSAKLVRFLYLFRRLALCANGPEAGGLYPFENTTNSTVSLTCPSQGKAPTRSFRLSQTAHFCALQAFRGMA